MRNLLECGTTLVVDRYSFSGVAFTAAKQVRKSFSSCISTDVILLLVVPFGVVQAA